jgi:hypothetical protein
MVNMPLRVAFEELMVELEGGYRAATFPSGSRRTRTRSSRA